MTAALEALSGVSVASVTSDRLDLKLTTDVACDHLSESGCCPCILFIVNQWLGTVHALTLMSPLDCTSFTAIHAQ